MKKVLLISIPLFLLCTCVLVIGGFVFAFNSNTNIPVVSNLVERLENVFVNEETFKTQLVKEIENIVNSDFENVAPASNEFKSVAANYVLKLDVESEEGDFGLDSSGDIMGDSNGDKVFVRADLDLDFSGIKVGGEVFLMNFINNMKSETFIKLEEIPSFLSMNIEGLEDAEGEWVFFSGDVERTIESTPFAELDTEKKAELLQLINTDEFKSLISRGNDRVSPTTNIRSKCIIVEANELKMTQLLNKYEEIAGSDIEHDLLPTPFRFTSEMCFGRKDGALSYLNFEIFSPQGNGSFTLGDIRYSNEPVSLEKPSDYISIEDLNLSFPFLEGAQF